jgi:hypothetical protein
MKQLVSVNLTTKTSSDWTPPALTFNEDLTLALRLYKSSEGSTVDAGMTVNSIQAAIGLIDARPLGGKYAVKIGSGALSEGANATAQLDSQASASAVAAALNALSEISTYGTCRAISVNGSLLLMFGAQAAEVPLQVVNNDLWPVSFGRVNAYQIDGKWIHELRLTQTPVAFTSTFETVLPQQPAITEIIEGGTTVDGQTAWNEVQQLFVPPEFTGTYVIKNGTVPTVQLSNQDGISTIQAALDTILGAGNTVVTLPLSNRVNIEFTGTLAGASHALLTTQVEQVPVGDTTFTLALNTAELWVMLRASGDVKLPLEIRLNCTDSEGFTAEMVALSMPVEIAPPVIFPELADSPSIDWLIPASPKDYIPFTSTQVLTGQQQAFSAVVGDGSATSFLIAHGLASELCQIVVCENSRPGRVLRDNEYTVELVDNNSLTLAGFASVPTHDQFAIYVTAIGPASVFQAHTNTVPQIVAGGGYPALTDFMDSINSRIATLESIIPTVSGAGVTTAENGITIPIQQISEVIGYKGAATPDAALGLKDSALPPPRSLAPQSKFDRELWRVAVNSNMFALGRILRIDWGVALQLLRANCAAEYRLVLELGTYADDGGTPNHLVITWATDPVFSQPIVLTDEMTVHSFGAIIKRGMVSGTDTFTLDQMLYGILSGNNAAAPANANFAIRSRLILLRTESTDPAKGWVSFGVLPSITPTSGSSTGCQASITSK